MPKKLGQFKSLLFPQFKESPVIGVHIRLPKIGAVPINLHRPIPDGFVVKQVRIIKKADRWYAAINIQCDANVPNPMPYGHPIGIDIGLEKFLATSDGVLVKPPKFFKNLQSELKSPNGQSPVPYRGKPSFRTGLTATQIESKTKTV